MVEMKVLWTPFEVIVNVLVEVKHPYWVFAIVPEAMRNRFANAARSFSVTESLLAIPSV